MVKLIQSKITQTISNTKEMLMKNSSNLLRCWKVIHDLATPLQESITNLKSQNFSVVTGTSFQKFVLS